MRKLNRMIETELYVLGEYKPAGWLQGYSRLSIIGRPEYLQILKELRPGAYRAAIAKEVREREQAELDLEKKRLQDLDEERFDKEQWANLKKLVSK
jgi:hypothetical protein